MKQLLSYQFNLKKVAFDSLDFVTQESLQRAVEVRKNAYCPYSKFQVGASVITEDDLIFTGCNVENSTHISICAERVAYVKAVSEGHKNFKSVAVIADQENCITPPCGTCRQFMNEFGDVTIYLAKPHLEEVFCCKLSELLPLQFKWDLSA